ncbi:translocation/assembly module TamB domain-containing protein [Desulfonatronovibrio hydrogenovorans]|uniref:translocation/assembly module TamB domain-containing protein n=1 Tax=Desulfonatronovibrio hydrogenovorans TaxID=53245 RepID=UPI00048F06D0|nr:translocation/assembly module TamB domain-containing protein [Desulfonatronovibrio hydrogenovorans]
MIRSIRPILIFFATGVALLVTLFCLVLILIQTGPGQKILENTLNRALDREPVQVVVTGISGRIPFDLSVDKIEVKDDQGTWLSISQTRLRWSLWQLLKGSIHIHEAGAAWIDLKRSPSPVEREREPWSPEIPRWTWPLPPLTMERLYLEEILISDSILDEQMSLNLEAELVADSQGFSLAGLELNRTDQPVTLVKLKAALTRDPYYLDLDLHIFDAGTLNSFLDIPGWPHQVELTLAGSGPVDTWEAHLFLDGQDAFHADLGLSLEKEDLYFLTGLGEVYVNPELVPMHGFDLTGNAMKLDFKTGFKSGERIILDRLDITSPAIKLAASADLAISDMELRADLDLELQDINPFLQHTDFTSSQPLVLSAAAKGPATRLAVNTQARLGGISGHGLSLDELDLTSHLSLGHESSLPASLLASLKVRGAELEQYQELPQEFGIDLNLSYTSEKILLADVATLTSQDLNADLQGYFDPETLDYAAELEISVNDVQNFIPGPEDPFFKSHLAAHIEAHGSVQHHSHFAKANISLSELNSNQEIVAVLLGPNPRLNAKISLDEHLDLQILEAEVVAGEFNLDGSGRIGLRTGDLDAEALLDIHGLVNAGLAVGQKISGTASVDFEAHGDLKAPQIYLVAQIPELQWEGINALSAHLRAEAVLEQGLPTGDLDLAVVRNGIHLNLTSDFAVDSEKILVKELRAAGPGLTMAGEMDYRFAQNIIQGEIKTDLNELDRLGKLFDLDLSGSISSRIHLRPHAGQQYVEAYLSGRDLVIQDLTVAGLNISGEVDQAFTSPSFQGSLELSGVRTPGAVLQTARMDILGTPDHVQFKSDLKGKAVHPVEVVLEGEYTRQDLTHILSLNTFSGFYAYEEFLLNKPASLEYAPDLLFLDQLELSVGSGTLRTSVHLNQDLVQMNFNLDNVSAREIPLAVSERIKGTVSMDLEISGRSDEPALEARLQLNGLTPVGPDLEYFDPMILTASVLSSSGRLQLQADLEQEPASLAVLNLELPVSFSIVPLSLSLDQPVPLSGSFTAGLDLESVSAIALPPDQILTGELTADLSIAGSLQAPELKGMLNITSASFEHIDTGLFLTDLDIRAETHQNRIDLDILRGSDGAGGRINGSGYLEFAPEGNMPWQMELAVENARVANHSLAVVTVSSAALKISGDKSEADLAGRIVFSSVEASLPDQAPPGVVDLDVTEINLPDQEHPVTRSAVQPGYPISLDLDLIFPSRVFVRGRGLDSEWEGNLRITGQTSSPSVRGSLNVVRGRLMLLDRRFNLVRESYVNLDGSFPPDPNIDISAEYRQRDRIINVRVFGPALNPELLLSSDPPMPQDEILAWTLFGRDLSTLTPFQAIQLANAARVLALGQTGPDLMGEVRTIIGVDDIDITRDPEEGYTQFGLGKYVHERVYVQVKKGTAPGTDSVSVEVELSPRISLESNVDSDSEGGIGIFWKHDY